MAVFGIIGAESSGSAISPQPVFTPLFSALLRLKRADMGYGMLWQSAYCSRSSYLSYYFR